MINGRVKHLQISVRYNEIGSVSKAQLSKNTSISANLILRQLERELINMAMGTDWFLHRD